MTRLDRFDHDLRYEIGFASERGRRPDNQDYCRGARRAAADRARAAIVAAVADGVGGHKGGREAAELTVRGFLDGFFALPGSLGIRQAAARSLDAVNSWIVAQGRVDPELAGMATTFTALILSGRSGHCVHVGDSRLYRFREDALEHMTEDHVMGRGDFKHILRRAVGMEDSVRLDHTSFSAAAARPLSVVQRRRAWRAERRRICAKFSPAARRPRRRRRISSPPRSLPAATTIAPRSSSIFSTRRPPKRANCAISSTNCRSRRRPTPGMLVDDYRIDALLADGRYSRLMRARGSAQRRAGRDQVSAAARRRGPGLSPRLRQRGLRRRPRAQPVDRRGDRAAARSARRGSIR